MADVQDILLMVGPYGDWIKHDLEERTVLVSECDGVRLLSAEKHELLSRVPDSLVDVFKIGSTAPGAVFGILPYLASMLPGFYTPKSTARLVGLIPLPLSSLFTGTASMPYSPISSYHATNQSCT